MFPRLFLASPLSRHWQVSRIAIPIILGAKGRGGEMGKPLLPVLKSLVCRGQGSNTRSDAPIYKLPQRWLLREKLNPFTNKPWFLRLCSTSLSKTLLEKDKLVLTSNFSFSQSVFFPFGERSAIFLFFFFFSNSKESSANSLGLEEFKSCCLGKR